VSEIGRDVERNMRRTSPRDVNQESALSRFVHDRVSGRAAYYVCFFGLVIAGEADGVLDEQFQPVVEWDTPMLVPYNGRRVNVFLSFGWSEIYSRCKPGEKARPLLLAAIFMSTYFAANAEPSRQGLH
jgi:hypothetical protein